MELLVESPDLRALHEVHQGELAARPVSVVELSIVMPCLNEAETLARCIDKATRFLDESGVAGEIVIGDNGSTDGSIEIGERHGARVVDVPIRGYGAAVYHAALAAKGRYVIMGDADDSYDFSALTPLVAKLRDGYDVVMGNRFLGGVRPGAMPWKNRYIGNPILSSIGRLRTSDPGHDAPPGDSGIHIHAWMPDNSIQFLPQRNASEGPAGCPCR